MKAIALSLALSLGALFLTQCSSSSNGSSTAGDAGACPADPPTVGTACTLTSGTQCSSYPTAQSNGCSPTYVCENGTWSEVGTAVSGIAFACPATVPTDGTACFVPSSCVGGPPPADPSCNFGCDQGGNATATCTGGKWVVTPNESLVACPIDGGADASGTDAGDGG